jgi:hypothetical protein
MPGTRKSWLSITPEPEVDLPRAVATLRAGAEPGPEAVARERERAERAILRGSRRGWNRWLEEARVLAAGATPGSPAPVGDARRLTLDVISNHDALELGLPGPAARNGRSPRGGRRKR